MQHTLDRILSVHNEKTVFRDGEEHCVVLYYADYPELKVRILKEGYCLALMENILCEEVRAPRFCGVEKIEGRWGLVTSYHPGKTLAQYMKEDAQRRKVWMRKLADIQAVLHKKREEQLPCAQEEYSEENNNFGICMGGLDPADVLIGTDGNCYVLTWEEAYSGNPLLDAEKTWLKLLCRYGEACAEEYRERYCECMSCIPDDLELFRRTALLQLAAKGNRKEAAFYRSLL